MAYGSQSYGGGFRVITVVTAPQVAASAALTSTSTMAVSATTAAGTPAVNANAALVSTSTLGGTASVATSASAALLSTSTLSTSATVTAFDVGPTTVDTDTPPAFTTTVATNFNGDTYTLTRVSRHYPHAHNRIGFNKDHSQDRQTSSEIIFNFPGSPVAGKISPPYVLAHPGTLIQLIVSAGTKATTDTIFNLFVHNNINGLIVKKIVVLHLPVGAVTAATPVYYPCVHGDYFQAALPTVGSGLQDFVAQAYF